MFSDQENLLSNAERDPNSIVHQARCNGFITAKTLKKNYIILVISIFVASSLVIYFYLNLVAINENQSDQNRYKPLSRRKPILDHESIFSDSGPSLIRLTDLMAHCIVALQIAGREVVKLSLINNEQLDHVGSKGKTKEGVDDVVTGVDLKSHHMIVSTIKDSYRRLNLVSEEDSTKAFEGLRLEKDILPIKRVEFATLLRNNLHQIENQHEDRNSLIAQHETLVWIDPLDATKEYSENLTEYVTLMSCIVHKSKPIVGIIHKPFTNQTFWSIIDEKTGQIQHSPDLKKIYEIANDPVDNDKKTINVIVSRSHAGDIERILGNIYNNSVVIRPAGGSGYKTIELLSGKTDAYVHITHIKKWDICAPYAILKSLNQGNLTDLEGNNIDFGDPNDKVVMKGLIASMNNTMHDRLIKDLANLIRN